MANPNQQPRYTKNNRIASVLVTAANTSSQGGGTIATDIFLALQADTTNGTYIEKVIWIPTATTPTTTSATVARVFASSIKTSTTTSANTHLLAEITLQAVAADNASAAAYPFVIALGYGLPADWTLLVTNHAAPTANTAWRAVVIGGDY